MHKYDYIIIGAGLSGLTLAAELADYLLDNNKTLLIIDPDFTHFTNRTWSFWTQDPAPYADISLQTWDHIRIAHGRQELWKPIAPFTYVSIDGSSFRRQKLEELAKNPQISYQQDTIVNRMQQQDKLVSLKGEQHTYIAEYVFDSSFDIQQLKDYQGVQLYQQFVGYFIRSKRGLGNQKMVDMMDFRTEQKEAIAFFYVLPFKDQTLVEYTLFTDTIRERRLFEEKLEAYLANKFDPGAYTIVDQEEGIIPMSSYRFRSKHSHIIPIGTAGGCSKASSGYTFTFAQRQAKRIVRSLQAKKSLKGKVFSGSGRFDFYDRTILRIFYKHPERSAAILTQLFALNPTEQVLKFLNNETSLWEEIKLFSSLPIPLFTKYALLELLKPGRK